MGKHTAQYRGASLSERFWAKVDFDGPLPSPYLGRCWLWTAMTYRGYGRFQIGRKAMQSHRVGYELVRGPIPAGLELDHLCREHACVNPAHLEAVTHQENVARGNVGRANRRKTHCAHRHPFTPENTYVAPNGERRCHACRKALRNPRERIPLTDR